MSEAINAVMTGDLVASRDVPPSKVDTGIDLLSRGASEFGTAWDLDLGFTRSRGDGWQTFVAEPRLAVRAMLFLRATLIGSGLGLDTRISLGFGSVESRGTRDLSDGSGTAFFISGDHLERAGRRRFVIAGSGIGRWQTAVVLLLDEIVGGWTAAQAEAAAYDLLADTTQEEIAGHLGITRQAVQLRLAGASMNAVAEALFPFETHDYGDGTTG